MTARLPTLVFTRWRRGFATSAAWTPVIGLELHIQLSSKQKLFSGGQAPSLQSAANSLIVPFDAGFPGTLPIINKECVLRAVQAGLAFGGVVQRRSSFDRKHYFYPDLPHGYQITQHREPIVTGGYVELDEFFGSNPSKRIRIREMHLEMDSGKSFHEKDQHLVDLNRAGVALLEIVTEPDIVSASEASMVLKKVQETLRCVGVSDCNMEESSMRCDVNVSLAQVNGVHGDRCEIKNVNSNKFIMTAIEFEIRRQTELMDVSGCVPRETRGFDAKTGTTYSLRSKENLKDYRYMPEPDLPPLVLSKDYVKDIKAALPPLPGVQRARLRDKYGFGSQKIMVIMNEPGAMDYVETLCKLVPDPNLCFTWVMTELLGKLGYASRKLSDNLMPPEKLAVLLGYVARKEMTAQEAKKIMIRVINGDQRDIKTLVEESGCLELMSDDEVFRVCDQVIMEDQNAKQGLKPLRSIDWFVGQVMKRSKGKAKAQLAAEFIRSKISQYPSR